MAMTKPRVLHVKEPTQSCRLSKPKRAGEQSFSCLRTDMTEGRSRQAGRLSHICIAVKRGLNSIQHTRSSSGQGFRLWDGEMMDVVEDRGDVQSSVLACSSAPSLSKFAKQVTTVAGCLRLLI